MTYVYRSEMTPERWVNSTGLPPDGREHFRELKQYGNRHVVFERNAEWGQIHIDEYNATDFPVRTVNHLAKYTNEKTGVPENLAKAAIVFGALYLGYRGLRSLKIL